VLESPGNHSVCERILVCKKSTFEYQTDVDGRLIDTVMELGDVAFGRRWRASEFKGDGR
jgi:hypothetical protein